jgi:sugar lactone lactonase YvrE
MARFGEINAQYFDDAGDPLSSGKIYFYETGTTTLKDTFSDINQTIANTNPVILTAAGRQPNIFFSGTAKAILVDKNDVQILVRDPVGQTASVFGDGWVATKIYSADAVVLGSDGQYYRSLAAGNQNNDPTSTSGYWTLLYSVEWNSGITYQEGAVVTYNGEQYQSLQNTNLNNNPSSATSYWVLLSFAWLSTRTYAINENAVGTDGILYTSLQNSNTGNIPASSPAYWVGTSAAAAASATAAASSATAAATSATSSATSATASATSATASATSATASETAKAASVVAKDAAVVAKTAAETAETNAETAETNAETAETNSAASAAASATSAAAALVSQNAAASSATAAASSASSASGSSSTATTKAAESAASAAAALVSQNAASTSASTATTQAGIATTKAGESATSATASASSATAAAGSATSAASSATDAANKYDEFDDRYLGAKSSDPTVDNDGNALVTGAIYFNTSSNVMKVYSGSSWANVAPTATSITLSQVSDVTATAAEVNVLDGIPATLTATELGYVDGVTSSIQTQLNNISVTAGTQTKTYSAGETSTITLSGNVLSPIIGVTKEVAQSGVSNNDWDVNSSSENYTRYNTAPATTLDFGVGTLSNTSYASKSFSVASQETTPTGVAFNSDYSKMYIVGESGDSVYQYSLSTAGDVSTASYDSVSFSFASQETTGMDVIFNPDGTKMYIVGSVNDTVYQYTLTTGYDISTASYASKSFSLATQSTKPTGIRFNNDGTKLYAICTTTDAIYQYSLSTAYDISTASYDSVSLSVSAQDTAPEGLEISSDGKSIYVIGRQQADVYRYSLSTAYDLSTASYSSDSISVTSQETAPLGIAINFATGKMYVVGQTNDTVYQYQMPQLLQLGSGSFASADVGKTIEANSGVFILTSTAGAYSQTTAPTSYAQVASGSWEMYGVVFNTTDGDLELSGKSETYDLSSASDDSNSKLISGFDTTPEGIYVKNDGTKIWLLGNSGNDIEEFTMSTPYDLTTMTTVWAVPTPTGLPGDIYWKSDGTSYYISEDTDDRVYQYNVSTAWTFLNDTETQVGNANVSSQATDPQIVGFNDDGTKMFVIGRDQQSIFQYSLSTAWLASTASYDSVSYSLSSNGAAGPESGRFNGDGTKLFVVSDSSPESIVEFSMSTAYDISTLSPTGNSLNIQSKDTQPTGLAFADDGKKMYFTGEQSDTIYRYSTVSSYLPSGYHAAHTTTSTDSQYWTDINSMTADEAAGDGAIYYCVSTDDRTTWKIAKGTDGERSIVRNNSGTWQYNSNATYGSETWTNATTNAELAAIQEAMTGATSTDGQYDVSTASFVDEFSTSAQETGETGLTFNADGTKMFITGTSGDDVNEYALSTGFDVSSASYTQNFSVSSQTNTPRGVTFNADGTKMFIVDGNSVRILEYALTTGFDVSTASYTTAYSTLSQDNEPNDVAFNSAGTKMFVVGRTGDAVYEYTLSTGFDLNSTVAYSQSFGVSSQDNFPTGLTFNPDGTKMFITGDNTNTIYQYTLTTGFDVSTASYASKSFVTSTQSTSPQAIAFNSDGTKMFINGGAQSVMEYDIGTTVYTNQMNKTQLDAIPDANHFTLANDLDLAIIFNMPSGTTVPSSDGVAINYDANVLNQGAILGTDYTYDAPAQNKVRITSTNAANLKVRIV